MTHAVSGVVRAALRRLSCFGTNSEETLHLDDVETVTLWRPVGPAELALVECSGMRAFPPRLSDQPIFYPVTTEAYATRLASQWNARRDGGGHVTRFEVRKDFLDRYPPQVAGGRDNVEHWIPAEEMDAFNAAIVGKIVVTAMFDPDDAAPSP